MLYGHKLYDYDNIIRSLTPTIMIIYNLRLYLCHNLRDYNSYDYFNIVRTDSVFL